MPETREHIRNRMLQVAARAWGYPETEAESSFDPIVSMLLSVNAAEFERVSGEIAGSRARVLERMVELLSPDMLTGPLPAHAIMSATAQTDIAIVDQKEQFFFSRKTAADNGQVRTKDVFFTPTGSFQVSRSNIRYMATGSKLYQLGASASKELLAYNTGPELSPSVLWIGIDHPSISLHNAQFYFELRNEVIRPFFYTQLPKATWKVNGQMLGSKAGYNDPAISSGSLDISQVLRQQSSVSHKVLQDINEFYRHCFITITDTAGRSAQAGTGCPAEIEAAFPVREKKLFEGEQVRWVQVLFPENITSQMLEDVNCQLNCMPVVNRRLHELTYRLQDTVNIVPMITEDLYLDMEEVTDQDGRLLHIRDLEARDQDAPAILLRSGGVARFDERDAGAVIENIIQLLRDESAAFSRLGRDFVAGEIRQLQQIVNKLEQQLRQKQLVPERVPYLLIRRQKKEEIQHLFVRYWSVTGKAGNDIKAGTALMPYRSGNVDHNRVWLVTVTRGGRDRLNATDSITAYKSAVLSKDRIMSREDIRLFCLRQLGGQVSEIRVEKGIMVSADESQGFAKTIDVHISLHRKDYIEAREKNEITGWEQGLALQLADRSMSLTPYRVFIAEAQS